MHTADTIREVMPRYTVPCLGEKSTRTCVYAHNCMWEITREYIQESRLNLFRKEQVGD